MRPLSRDFVLSADGTRIAYEASGVGPALVFVNGALSDRSAIAPFRPHLDPRFTVIGYDRRGRGGSGDSPPYALAREIEDLAAVIQAVGAPALVYAHSSGAILALRAAMGGLPIHRLAVNEPPFILNGTRPLPPADLPKRIEALLDAGDRDAALRLFLVDHVGIPATAVAAMSARPAWSHMLSLAHTVLHDAAIAGTSAVDLTPFAALTTRTLVLTGTASFPWIAVTARALATILPDAELVELPGQPHSPAPEVVAPLLIRFFAA
jgi:pimeloyl-ACP methyl ester carboxylesterase